jgi:hypothetical protein
MYWETGAGETAALSSKLLYSTEVSHSLNQHLEFYLVYMYHIL